QQRVALARAIVKDAKVLLLDELLSNLDAKLREQMRRELRRLQKQVGTTSIYVTHDQDEALALSDRIAVMSDGRVVELGKPVDLYMRPRHPFTARFVGQADLVACTPVEATAGAVLVDTPMGRLRAEENADLGRGTTHVMVRPEHVVFVDSADAPNTFTGRISNMVFTGKLVEYDVEVPGGTIAVYSPSSILRNEGEEVHVHLPPSRCVALSEEAAT
ncbi:MAG: ABC transporter ATP-binding protein, partial [Rhodobacteraceae bacterium]|nr:ABC transporter ATP-binding protein [Paracoccaceae bacterium]